MKGTLVACAVAVLFSWSTVPAADIASFPICTADGHQTSPKIDGSIVVWDDARDGASGVYGFNLLNHQEFPIDSGGPGFPAVSGDLVAYRSYRGSFQLSGYSISTATKFLIQAGDDGAISASGNVVVWRERVWQNKVCGKNLSTGDIFETPSFAVTGGSLSIDGDVVVYDGDGDIYAYVISTGETINVCIRPDTWQISPSISGSIVVWTDYRNSESFTGGTPDIYGYDLSTGQEFAICTHSGFQNSPAISGDLIVWEDRRNGPTKDIYAAFIPEPATLSLLALGLAGMFLRQRKTHR